MGTTIKVQMRGFPRSAQGEAIPVHVVLELNPSSYTWIQNFWPEYWCWAADEVTQVYTVFSDGRLFRVVEMDVRVLLFDLHHSRMSRLSNVKLMCQTSGPIQIWYMLQCLKVPTSRECQVQYEISGSQFKSGQQLHSMWADIPI
jgi:hypothetical protein